MPSDGNSLTVLLAVAVLAAGCLGAPAPGSTPTDAGTATPTATSTPPSGTPTHTLPRPEYAAERPDPGHRIAVENEWNRSVTVRVTVVREAANETVHEGTYEVAAGEERTVYGTAEANPDGIERFSVTATALNTTESVTIETSRCYGNVHVEITADGELSPYYAIC